MELLQLLYGTNIIRIEDKIKSIAREYVGTLDDFNYTKLNFKETPVEQIIEEAQTLPFLADRKVIVVEEAVLFTAQKTGTAVNHNIDLLIDYLKNKSDDTLIIFAVITEKLDKRKKVTKLMAERGKQIEINEMNEKELMNYVRSVFDRNELEISSEALTLLLEKTSYKYAAVHNEVTKLVLYAEGNVTLDDVENVVSVSLEQNVFLLTDFILKNEKQKAVQLARELILQKEEPMKLLHLVIGQFRLLYQVKILNGEGYQEDNIARTLKVHPYRVKLAQRHTRKFPLEVLLAKMVICRDIDYKFKSSYLDRNALFELFILEI
ncbi:DNA polymerase III subunit delta [Jeotgalicoccus coquinae]|uniref:DNA polymerase III subunit delta n=1 Tax=Jeotgalicoccus coquinae TaxID=709509 RepID=A0A6V7RA68_9STAP|nr:DNA polymerase III subunit delta [Jeotgalicoccus coquinae]MBB6422823.1 DNA polymerase-3 subunit delta [Jeotgalicoccus coquinae]GGE12896.1 DNA polymerase III subunit delta [Jeotgalicoccus coquinae]CAD2074063.1 DNA polymerase III subunit delta [Jeotgalicoccus coquinae]